MKANFKQYLFVINELTAREIKRRYAGSSLGIIWSVLNPLLHMVVISLVFSTMFRRSIDNFPIYFLTGQIFWTLFSTATQSAMTALSDNRSLLVRTRLPRQTFVLSRIYTALANFGYTCVAYVVMLAVFRVRLSVAMLLFPAAVLFMLAISTGVGYILSVAYIFFEDVKWLYSVFLTLWMYLSALFYPVSKLPEAMQTFVGYNPIYIVIAFARTCVMEGKVPDVMIWIRLVGWSFTSLAVGYYIFRSKGNQVMQKI